MNLFEEAIATLGVPGSIAVVLIILFAALQLIGEFVNAFGKAAPAFLSIRKVITKRIRKKKEEEQDTRETLKEVKSLLAEVNAHYNADNIAKRDEWMAWVNARAVVYDSKVNELTDMKTTLDQIVESLKDNTATTDSLYKENCRTTIIEFSHLVGDPNTIISEEEFRRVQKVYDDYEEFLASRNEPNGQVEMCYAEIQRAYTERLRTNNFLEYMRNNH